MDASGEVTSIVGGEKADLKAPKVPAKPAQAKNHPRQARTAQVSCKELTAACDATRA